MQEDNMENFIDFILNDEVKKNEKELGLSHPSVDYEQKERLNLSLHRRWGK